MKYLLDANVVSYFFHAEAEQSLAQVAGRAGIAMVGEVRAELEASPKHGGRFTRWLPTSGIVVRDIELGSPEHSVLIQLSGPNLRGRGERASIAVAAMDAELVFVANDKNAMWMALRELHQPTERFIGVPVFLRRLRDLGVGLDAVDAVLRMSQVPRPTWWHGWRSGEAAK